jgi:hypothetical protein
MFHNHTILIFIYLYFQYHSVHNFVIQSFINPKISEEIKNSILDFAFVTKIVGVYVVMMLQG